MAFGAIAQLGERYNGIVEVGGSIPPSSTNNSLKRLDFSSLFFFWILVWKMFDFVKYKSSDLLGI